MFIFWFLYQLFYFTKSIKTIFNYSFGKSFSTIYSLSILNSSGFGKDPEGSKFEIYATVPNLALNGDYKINGKILVLPIQGDGKSKLNIENMNLVLKFKPRVITKNGKNYIQTDKFSLTFTTTRLTIQLDNLFNGDKLLGDNMNSFLNENWQDILGELQPSISYAMEKILESIANRIFAKVPYDSLFLP